MCFSFQTNVHITGRSTWLSGIRCSMAFLTFCRTIDRVVFSEVGEDVGEVEPWDRGSWGSLPQLKGKWFEAFIMIHHDPSIFWIVWRNLISSVSLIQNLVSLNHQKIKKGLCWGFSPHTSRELIVFNHQTTGFWVIFAQGSWRFHVGCRMFHAPAGDMRWWAQCEDLALTMAVSDEVSDDQQNQPFLVWESSHPIAGWLQLFWTILIAQVFQGRIN